MKKLLALCLAFLTCWLTGFGRASLAPADIAFNGGSRAYGQQGASCFSAHGPIPNHGEQRLITFSSFQPKNQCL